MQKSIKQHNNKNKKYCRNDTTIQKNTFSDEVSGALPKGNGKLMIYRGGFETLVICKSITVNT